MQTAVDELDGLEESARRLTLPYCTEAALAKRFDEPVAGDGLFPRGMRLFLGRQTRYSAKICGRHASIRHCRNLRRPSRSPSKALSALDLARCARSTAWHAAWAASHE